MTQDQVYVPRTRTQLGLPVFDGVPKLSDAAHNQNLGHGIGQKCFDSVNKVRGNTPHLRQHSFKYR